MQIGEDKRKKLKKNILDDEIYLQTQTHPNIFRFSYIYILL